MVFGCVDNSASWKDSPGISIHGCSTAFESAYNRVPCVDLLQSFEDDVAKPAPAISWSAAREPDPPVSDARIMDG
jgi:hypothetical protein